MNSGREILGGKQEKLIVLILLTAFLFQGGTALLHMSSTGDETHYLGVGMYLMKNRQWAVLADSLLHPPLSYYLQSLPLFITGIDERVFEIPDMNERGRTIMASYPDDRMLILARIPMLLMGAFLGLLVYWWVRQVYGPWAALFAFCLYVFNPVMLGNSSLITPDLSLAFFTVLTFYCTWRFLVTKKTHMLVATGIAMGLCLLAKYSAFLVVLALPIFIVLQYYCHANQKSLEVARLRPSHFAVILLIAILVVNCGYFFVGSFQFLHGEVFKSDLFQEIKSTGIFKWIPSPLPRDYVIGLDWQYTVVEKGFMYFLLGETSGQGWFHYYFVSFFVKSPVVLLLFLGGAIFCCLRYGQDRLQMLVLIPILLFPLYFSVFKISRGIRYLLPIYPLLFVWISQMAAWNPERVIRRFKWLFLALLFFIIAESLWVRPHYLAYFNAAVGGPSRGQNYLYESEFDWGQELKGLSAYLQRNKIDRIKFAYSGTADPRHYGIDFEYLQCLPPQPTGGRIAISATALQVWGCFDWLKKYEPVDKVGYTIFIYDLPPVED